MMNQLKIIQMMKRASIVLSGALLFGTLGFASAATTTTPRSNILGIPTSTFCSTYAKDVATKSVAINLIVKIKDNPSLKASLMRQYGTFQSLGKIHCKWEYAPEKFGYKATLPAQPSTQTDISNNEPIIKVNDGIYRTPEDYFTGYDESALAGLNDQQMTIISNRIAKAKTEYAEIVDELVFDGWIKPEDRNEMVGKITFKFSNNCSQLDGKILVRQWYNSKNEPIDTELINLFITINVCFTNNYENNYETFLDRIIYHELGHYYNYFYDKSETDFSNICRANGQSICTSSDFVSTYAQTSSDEDYAEMFAYYVYDRKPVQGAKLQSKIDYFKIRDPRY